jgi:hypothetical protein
VATFVATFIVEPWANAPARSRPPNVLRFWAYSRIVAAYGSGCRGSSKLTLQWTHCAGTVLLPIPELATLKPTMPKGLRHFGQGTLNKLQNAAIATTTITTAHANLTAKPLVAIQTSAPATRRKILVRRTYRRLRCIRYSRIVIAHYPVGVSIGSSISRLHFGHSTISLVHV